MFVCPRCNFSAGGKRNLLKHMSRKRPCKNVESSTEVNNTSDNGYTCIGCNRMFSGARYLTQHQSICPGARAQQEIKVLQKQLEEERAAKHSTTNITTNINIININNFGSEDRSYIKSDVMQQCLDSMRIYPLIDGVYFNLEHPENHTVRLKSEKQGRVHIRQGDAWVEGDLVVSIDAMMFKENMMLSKFFYDEVWSDPSIEYEKKAWTQAKLVKINDRVKDYFEQRRVIKAKLKAFTFPQS